MAGQSDLGNTLRERRRALGLSRTRLAERSGLATRDIARWERGDGHPDGDALLTLADAVGFDVADTRRWMAEAVTVDLTGPEVDVRIHDTGELAANPFTERSRLIHTDPGLADRVRSMLTPRKRSSPPRLQTVSTPRPAPTARTGLARPARRTAPGIIPDVPGGAQDPVVRVYSTTPRPSGAEERSVYLSRRVGTALAITTLAVVLWWAIGELGQGLGDLFDLFRTPIESGNAPPT